VAQSAHKLHLTLASNTTEEAPSHQSAAATSSCTGKAHQRGTRQRRERAMQEPPKRSHTEEAPCCHRRPVPATSSCCSRRRRPVQAAATAQFKPQPPLSSSRSCRPVPSVDACEALLGCLGPKFQTLAGRLSKCHLKDTLVMPQDASATPQTLLRRLRQDFKATETPQVADAPWRLSVALRTCSTQRKNAKQRLATLFFFCG
jgi:hypothetical protein